ncbi:MAG: bifunctional nuclease family protein [Armatimonadota bacterium]
MTTGADEVRVEVVGVFEQDVAVGEEQHRIPVVLLRDLIAPPSREVRVPIGSCEALAIQVALEARHLPRPLTHDLALRLLDKLSARLDRVVVDGLSGHHVHATLYLQAAEGEIEMGARPGDAVALALRADVPVLVKDDILAGGSETA